MPWCVGLAAAGLLPFLFGAAMVVGHAELAAPLTSSLAIYTVIIVAFMAGAGWGLALGRAPALLVFSNIMALLLWLGWLLFPVPLFFLVAAITIILLLPAEAVAYRYGWISRGYWRLRLVITLVAASCLFIMGGGLS